MHCIAYCIALRPEFALRIENIGGFVKNQLYHYGRAKASRQGSKQHTTGITHQMSYKIFTSMDLAPTTNCGAESQFAKIGNVLKQTGGSL